MNGLAGTAVHAKVQAGELLEASTAVVAAKATTSMHNVQQANGVLIAKTGLSPNSPFSFTQL